MPGDEATVEGSSAVQNGESLSCITCRNRKLKCCRIKPVCERCAKSGSECIYPESRRKPVFKRKNVRELEARLAQVEDLLKKAGDGAHVDASAAAVHVNADTHDDNGTRGEPAIDIPTIGAFDFPISENVLFQGLDYSNGNPFVFGSDTPQAFSGTSTNPPDPDTSSNMFGGELLDLGGILEPLPPFEVMEELNQIFFERQHQFAPVIHPARYLQAFYSAPHMKPPLCLQYAIWGLASHAHSKYHEYWKIFYTRARRYAEVDEMKGYGEHFITVAHAQAWSCLATLEAKSLQFTRAAMSCARGVRLCEMMGLHRLDTPVSQASPTLAPPKDWAELEERRRVFWGFFCIDSHASISTGWPNLIDLDDVTTHLPASETAFHSGEPMETCRIHDVFKGHPYTSFAASAIICHIFNQILKHVHRPKDGDHPENYEYGEYWKRHRDLDNTLSSAFMFLPEPFQLPEHYRDPAAIHCNINIHASVICLHHAAIERIEQFKLSDSAKKASQGRLLTAAQEIVNIMKLASHMTSQPRTPLAAISLYCAASVFIYFCSENPTPSSVDNLEFLLSAMAALSRLHMITRSFLRQAILDIEYNGIQDIIQASKVADLNAEPETANNIPLLARSRITRHSDAQSPLPGRLPLGNPIGKILPDVGIQTDYCHLSIFDKDSPSQGSSSDAHVNKRKRGEGITPIRGNDLQRSSQGIFQEPSPLTTSTYSSTQGGPSIQHQQNVLWGSGMPTSAGAVHSNLPHRTDPTSPQEQPQPADEDPVGVTIAPGLLGNKGPKSFTTAGRGANLTRHQKGGMGGWNLAGVCVSAIAEQQGSHHPIVQNGVGEPFGFLDVSDINIDWSALHESLGIDPADANTDGNEGHQQQ
ncbi:hypothetical protein F5Y16DRAFT_182741 [Xylariaceae sp. FL0255]|nr:hypothetical protein F5Y16DRAFT_182741 [Xylariaceae sp. FL0255]